MANRKKSVPGSRVGDVGQAGGGGSEDADAILDTALGIVRNDLALIQAAVAEQPRQLGIMEAQTVAGYVRALGAVARARSGRNAGGLGKMTMADLAAAAAEIPEVRAAMEAGE